MALGRKLLLSAILTLLIGTALTIGGQIWSATIADRWV